MTETGFDGGAPAAYLVVLRHVLVAQDIAMTIAEFDPAARVATAAGPAEALPLLEGVERVAVAFVGMGPEAYRASALSRAVAERGGRVVLLGEEAELAGEAAGFAVLVRPFTTGNILGHLAGREG
jgi:hypothetical protein